jgi:hypothetical protein
MSGGATRDGDGMIRRRCCRSVREAGKRRREWAGSAPVKKRNKEMHRELGARITGARPTQREKYPVG